MNCATYCRLANVQNETAETGSENLAASLSRLVFLVCDLLLAVRTMNKLNSTCVKARLHIVLFSLMDFTS